MTKKEKSKRKERGGETAPGMKKSKTKKTEVETGLEAHAPQQINKMKEKIEKSDIIIPEIHGQAIEKVKKAFKEEEEEKKLNKKLKDIAKEETKHPETTFKLFKSLEKAVENPKKEVRGVRALEEAKEKLGIDKPYKELTQKERAKLNELREEIRTKRLKKLLKRSHYQGKKIYIGAGATHTPIYHKLKEHAAKEKEGMEVKRDYLFKEDLQEKVKEELEEKGFSEEKAKKHAERIKDVYNPPTQAERIRKFETPSKEKLEESEEREYKNKTDEYWIQKLMNSLILKSEKKQTKEERDYEAELKTLAERAADRIAEKEGKKQQ